MRPEDVMKDYEARLNRHRFEDVEPLIAADAVFWFNDGSHRGIDAVWAAFTRTFESPARALLARERGVAGPK